MKASHFDFVLWQRFSYFLFFLKNEGFTLDFVFWWRFLWLHILTKVSLASYFDEGFLLWLHILTKASHFDFVFWWRFRYFFIFYLKNEGFTPSFVFWWMLHFFYEKWRLHTWLRILMNISFFLWKMKASHFSFVFWWRHS
jgi:hypothetical protein